MSDEGLIGPHAVPERQLAFCCDGSRWLHWSSWSTEFTVSRYTWTRSPLGELALKFHHTLGGTWSIDNGVTRHDVDSDEKEESVVEVGHPQGAISPAISPLVAVLARASTATRGRNAEFPSASREISP
ncbi:hypothetical protein [Amycolatopsis sp. cmx-11-32]|uniref:hypothetical protein n=1 Tax=Amycolatopsis sp. cmx-11-32 TaxID=2785796 RepID=UPI0039E34499